MEQVTKKYKCDMQGTEKEQTNVVVEDLDEIDDVVSTTEKGWVIHLLQTGELLTVHEETLHNGEMNV